MSFEHELDEFGNIVPHGTPSCSPCEDLLCMQVYNEETDTWTQHCPDCLATNTVSTPIEPVQSTPSGMPTEPYQGGVVPSGGVVVVCGESSKLVEHTFSKEVKYKMDGGMPWNPVTMRNWTAAHRRDMENGFASANVPNDVMAQFALDAFNDAKAKGKVNGITCGPCPADPDSTSPKACPLIVRQGTLKASETTGSNGRLHTSGRGATLMLNVAVTLTGKIRLWVFCNKDGC